MTVDDGRAASSPGATEPRRASAVAVALLVAVAIALRFWHLSRESLWFDEGYSWWMSTLSPGRLLHVLRADVSSPLYPLVLGAWTRVAGDDAIGLRSLSALLGALCVAPLWLLARRAGLSRWATVLAVALLATSATHVEYSQEARGYTLVALLLMLALASVAALARRRSWPSMLALAATASASLYTHPMSAFALAGVAFAWLAWPGERPVRGRLVDMAIAFGLAGLIYLPWLPVTLEQMAWMNGKFWIERPGPDEFVHAIAWTAGSDLWRTQEGLSLVSRSSWSASAVAHWVAYFVAFVVALAIRFASGDDRRRLIALAGFVFVPIVLAFAYSQVRQPVFAMRTLLAGATALPLLLAMAVDVLWRARRDALAMDRVIACASILAIVVPSLAALVATFALEHKEDWRGAYQTVASWPASQDRLLVFVANEGELTFLHYAAKDRSRPPEPRTGVPAGFFDADPPRPLMTVRSDDDLPALRATLASRAWSEVVLIECHEATADPDGRVRASLAKRFGQAELHELRKVRVTRFRDPA